MNQERWILVRALFDQARSLPPAGRAEFLAQECSGDDELRHEVESLLEYDGDATSIVDQPALGEDFTLKGSEPAAEMTDTSAPADIRSSTPEQIGNYRIIGVIGEGGMGVVYEAEQTSPHRVVALKVLRPMGTLSGEHELRFRREAETLGRLDHPGIARILEAGHTDDGQPWFAMELVRGVELDRWVREERPSIRQRLALFADLADTVHAAHQRGVVHRDLKPSNILVGPDGVARVLDFGLARIVDEEVAAVTMVTEVGRIMGTLVYMSPEQARGDNARIDTRSDIYALGVLLFELLTESMPYTVDPRHVPEAVRTICEEAPVRPSTLDRGLRGDLETIVLTALRKEPEQRYDSAAALGADVRRFIRHEPIEARNPSFIYTAGKLVRRHRPVAALTAIIALLLVTAAIAGVSLATRFEREARRNAEIAYRMRLVYAQQQHDIGNLAGMQAALAESSSESHDWVWGWLNAQAGAETLRIEQPGLREVAVLEGELLLIAVRQQTPDRNAPSTVEVRAGHERTLRATLTPHATRIAGLAISSDQRWLATGEIGQMEGDKWRADLVITDLLDGREAQRFTLNEPIQLLNFSPDGQRILVGSHADAEAVRSAGDNKSSVGFVDLDSQLVGTRGRTRGDVVASTWLGDGRTMVVSLDHSMLMQWSGSHEEDAVVEHVRGLRDIASIGQDLIVASREGVQRMSNALEPLLLLTDAKDIAAIATDPRGQLVAGADTQGRVHLWNARTAEPRGTSLVHSDGRIDVGFVPNGTWLYSIHQLKEVAFRRVVDQMSGRIEHAGNLLPEPRRFVGRDGTVVANQDRNSGILRRSRDDAVLAPAGSDLIDELDVTPAGSIVALSETGRILVWDADATDPRELNVLEGASALAIDEQTNQAWIGTEAGSAHAVDLTSGRIGPAFNLQPAEVTALVVTPKGQLISATAKDGAPLRIHDVRSGTPREIALPLGGVERRTRALAVDPTGSLLAGFMDGRIFFWRLDHDDREPMFTVRWPNAVAYSIGFTRDGETLRASTASGAVCAWSSARPDPKVTEQLIAAPPDRW